MGWESRIDLSFMLLKEIASLVGGEEAKEILDILLAMSDYVASDDFRNGDDKEKHDRSVEILGDAIGTCAKIIMRDSEPAAPPTYMTREQVRERLREEYLRSVSTDCEVASMSVSDWMRENNIVIVEEGDERLSGNDGEQSSGTAEDPAKDGANDEDGK